jgi:hypothetical protein
MFKLVAQVLLPVNVVSTVYVTPPTSTAEAVEAAMKVKATNRNAAEINDPCLNCVLLLPMV